MRLSANPHDPGYAAWRRFVTRGVLPDVYLNGSKLRDCVTADTKRGVAVVHARNEAGELKINHRRGRVVFKQVTGRVTIEFENRS